MIQPRITTGTLKGLKLKVPRDSRPITERVKRAMFDTILGYLEDTKCLDMFAGSGSIGIEAISRGAASCVFVDKDKNAIETIKENIHKAGIGSQTRVYMSEFRKFIHEGVDKFGIIFIDPPFDSIPYINLNSLELLLEDDGLVVFKSETGVKPKFPKSLKILVEKKVGTNTLYFLNLKENTKL